MAAVSATADPLMPAKNMLAAMLTWARPPVMWPTRLFGKLNDLVRQLTFVHDVAGRDKEGDGHDGKTVQTR